MRNTLFLILTTIVMTLILNHDYGIAVNARGLVYSLYQLEQKSLENLAVEARRLKGMRSARTNTQKPFAEDARRHRNTQHQQNDEPPGAADELMHEKKDGGEGEENKLRGDQPYWSHPPQSRATERGGGMLTYKELCGVFDGHQRRICRRQRTLKIMPSVLKGISLGLFECRFQFARHKWNCHGHNMTAATAMSSASASSHRGRRRRYRSASWRRRWNKKNKKKTRMRRRWQRLGKIKNRRRKQRRQQRQRKRRLARLRSRSRFRSRIRRHYVSNRPARDFGRNKKTYLDILMSKGTPESSFLFAVLSAGITFHVTLACSTGRYANCGCDQSLLANQAGIEKSEARYRIKGDRAATAAGDTGRNGRSGRTFKWDGCSHNVFYGIAFSRLFLGDEQTKHDIIRAKRPKRLLINVHNNAVGRQLLVQKMVRVCRCHGVSGSCELKTCLRSLPHFRVVGKQLKKKYAQALHVRFKTRFDLAPVPRSDLGNQNSGHSQRYHHHHWQHHQHQQHQQQQHSDAEGIRPGQLIYLRAAPNQCERNVRFGLIGTRRRACSNTRQQQQQRMKQTQRGEPRKSRQLNKNTDNNGEEEEAARLGQCDELCCNRGTRKRLQIRTVRCECRFKWCCKVECRTCTRLVELHTCK